MKAGDVERMLSTFSVETFADHFNLAAQIDHQRSLTYGNNNAERLDSIDSYTRALSIGQRLNSLYDEFIWQYLYLTNMEMYEQYQGKSFRVPNDDFVSGQDVTASLMDPDWLKKLEKLEVTSIETGANKFKNLPFFEQEEHFLDYQKKACEIYGCQEIAELIVAFELDGVHYCLMMELACYDGKWFNLTMSDGYCAASYGLRIDQAGLIPA